ncbi:MAG: carboxypeptidase regulatory-like domain-containing protein, partial [Gammaproteobacteria bacterium]|nr:carboxypeptidase regulatory-like domain-containing protein [Gammaproteobacteria bacterium]
MNRQITATQLIAATTFVLLFCSAFTGDNAAAQEPDPYLQRSTEIFNFSTTATEGAQRGEELYYYKCWKCHNAYSLEAGTPAPLMKNIFDRPVLISGEPVSDDTVADKIRDGGPGMPAFRHTLSDEDINDLLSYFRSDDCCFEGEEPPSNPRYLGTEPRAPLVGRGNFGGGPAGKVRNSDNVPLEGILVQLIAEETAIRTTVYSDATGQYEFPALPAGRYTLRIARPLEYDPYQRNSIRVEANSRRQQTFDDIVLDRISETELLPPTEEIISQLTGAEWIMNLPSTGEEKTVFKGSCGFGCHSYQQIFRNRYDERSWRLLVRRMIRYRGSP